MADIKKLFDLKGRVSVVTGGATGLGLQMAHALAEAGSNIVICSRKLENCETAAHEIEKLGVQALAVGCDVTKPDQVEALKDAAMKNSAASMCSSTTRDARGSRHPKRCRSSAGSRCST
jgi:NAD(P)-dependent dehydrogenase (short-subunit alcohol dehydrogenase family)